jgi:hypothetical protein
LFVPGLSFDELRQIGAGLGFSLRDDGRGMLQHQAVKRGLPGAVALVVKRCAVQRPLGRLADGLHSRLPKG